MQACGESKRSETKSSWYFHGVSNSKVYSCAFILVKDLKLGKCSQPSSSLYSKRNQIPSVKKVSCGQNVKGFFFLNPF